MLTLTTSTWPFGYGWPVTAASLFPQSRVYHWVSQSYLLQSRKLKQQVSRNSERVFWTNLTASELLRWAAPHLAYVLLQMIHKAVRGDFGPWFAGKCAILTELAMLRQRRQKAQALASHRT